MASAELQRGIVSDHPGQAEVKLALLDGLNVSGNI